MPSTLRYFITSTVTRAGVTAAIAVAHPRRMLLALVSVTAGVAASVLPLASVAAQDARPQVHIVATGGTIASTNYYSGRQGKIGIEQLLDAVPVLDSLALISGQQFSNVSSGSITLAMWLALAESINDTLRARPELAGVVVTHGTDTMEETAYFLDLTITDPRPVVVTGAMRPSDGVGIDGPANLRDAVRVAASPEARGRGTMVVMNDEILAARDVTKSNTVRPDAFTSPVRGDLGAADPGRLTFFREPHRGSVFDLSGLDSLPRVDIVYSYIGADGAGVDALVAAGARGIVVASTGRGDIPSLQRAAVQRAIASGVVVVVGSRTGSGSVPVGVGTRGENHEASTIGAGDLNVQKARVLLMLALTRSSDPVDVAKVFAANQ